MKKITLVLGASLKEIRYSNMAIKRLVAKGIPVVAFGLKAGTVDGVTIETEKKQFKDIDTVTLYMNALRQRDYYDYVIKLHPRRVIFNPGTENPEFIQLLREKGIETEIACTLVLLSINNY